MSYQAQRVPAWKRLGLKLKGTASGESPAPASSANTATTTPASAHHQSSPSSTNGIKRKEPPYTSAPSRAAPVQATNKRQRTDEAQSSPRKSVKFTEDTKIESATDKPAEEKKKKAPKKPKQKKTKPVAETPTAEPFSLEPSLAYLRQWHTDRTSWKFNKNHQTLLIKHVFDQGRIPAADVPLFYSYIRDLKGFVRTRLREQAAEIKEKDMEEGAAGFADVKEKEEKDTKQQLYEEVLSKLLKLGQESVATNDTSNANGKRAFDEVEFTMREMDDQVKQRVIKRMRAELVLDEVSDSEESTTSASTVTTTTASASSGQEETESAQPVREKPAVKLNDGTQPKAKRRRLRNTRTADISDSSSSESDSDSDSSSSDSSDDEDDTEMPQANGAETSSSSSSSSSSEDESDSDSESGSDAEGNEEGPGNDGDSEDE